ncbi:MAG: type II toxin-antitoxin system VapC family toxin [Gammaproteobacteria bacterium]
MVLVDTSVWIDHLRYKETLLVGLLESNRVLNHPFVRGELALGDLKQREIILNALDGLPQAPVVSSDEINFFIETHTLFGLDIGLIDAHLLASARLASRGALWTRDKRLLAAAIRLNLAMAEP